MIIGIAASSSKTQYYINQAYVDFVRDAGFQPLLIAPNTDLNLFANIIDGLILPGGIDLDPIYYGEDNWNSMNVDPNKDAFERALLHIVREQGKPIFGICRGFQLIIREYMLHDPEICPFMYFCSHIPNHAQTTDQNLDRTSRQHFVEYVPSVLYGGPQKTDYMAVNSMHHQCLVTDFGNAKISGIRGFKMAAWTDRGIKPTKNKTKVERVCEAFSIKGWGSPITAVQWHPEELRDVELLHNFFNKPAAAPQHLEA